MSEKRQPQPGEIWRKVGGDKREVKVMAVDQFDVFLAGKRTSRKYLLAFLREYYFVREA